MRKTIYVKNLKSRFHASYGNEKTGGKKQGMLAIGYYPGRGYLYYKDSSLVSDILGTCGCVDCSKCVKKCYAVSMVKRYEKACIARIENTMQLREDINAHFKAIYDTVIRDKIKIVRYTDSGEIENYLQFVKLVNLALSLPSTRFYLYTKNYAVLREFFGEGKQLPQNMVVLISIWENLGKSEFLEFRKYRNIKAFAVNSDLKCQAICPAYKKEDKRVKLNKEMTCAKCGLCWGKHPNIDIIGCLEH